MNEDYSEYLNSPAWQTKRWKRLGQSNFRCTACGSKKNVEVHHLTYERIFNEDMADLLPLCYLHHLAAEELIKTGKLTRSGNVEDLAKWTIKLLVGKRKFEEGGSEMVKPRNRCQQVLLQQAWFLKALRMGRKKFKRLIRDRFYYKDHHQFCVLSANCFALHQRFNRLRKT